MTVGILREPESDRRVALLPSETGWLIKAGVRLLVEKGAGDGTFTNDTDYIAAGAEIAGRKEVYNESDLLLTVNPPVNDNIALFREGQVLITVLNPVENAAWIALAKDAGITVLGMDIVPRSTRAQSMDVLSSMATVSGYKAVLDAAFRLHHFFPMFMTAAGTIKPARVLILGAGVAGLQAISTARKLGAIVEVFDVRPAVKEEVMSLGAKFIEVEGAIDDKAAGGYAVEQTEEFKKKQRELIRDRAIASDVIIATAQIPGRKAPVLITKETVESMKRGSVIIDLAASTGGNCEVTKNGKTITHNEVVIVGKSDYPADMSYDSSKLYGNNILSLLKLIVNKEGKLSLDFSDEIISGICAVHSREYISARLKQLLNIQ